MIEPGRAIVPGYEVIAHLHRGRTLDVYDVWSSERDCRCIAKTLRPDRAGERGPRAALVREGRLLRRIAHPHIVRAYETVETPVPVVVLETLTGGTLAHVIEAEPLSVAELALLGLHLCSAVGYLHRLGYIHMDLKPSNIVIEDGRAKVIDLSIARRPGRTRPGVGTWCYMAPEQAAGGAVGAATDVWGLGAVLFHAAVGRCPFEHDDVPTDSDEPIGRYLQLEGDAPPVATLAQLPDAVATVVDSCLTREASLRPTLDRVRETLASLPGVPNLRAPRRDAEAVAEAVG